VQRFRATIRKQGPNPYADVPERVSRAFSAWQRDGRISVVGRLNRAEIRATLVPIGRKGHRLYVNGGMRSAAGVEVGDTVTFELAATQPDDVRPPKDVAAELSRVPGARRAFAARSPSHRRQVLRYIDDARTPESRQRRIATAIDHVLGRKTPPARLDRARPLWTCPKCGNEFVNRNQRHSCRRYDLSTLFVGKAPLVRDLFDRFRAMVEACGPVKVLPYRDRVVFMVRVRFAGAVPKKEWLEVGFWLRKRVERPRFRRVETIYPNAHVHVLRVRSPEELDGEIAGWIEEAYAVGCQQDTTGKRRVRPA
jgi:Bacteriocin-protection, YdeI or OmpD-Associated/Domain of unknown function (DUF1905)/Domain of unknown function (DUF5655)